MLDGCNNTLAGLFASPKSCNVDDVDLTKVAARGSVLDFLFEREEQVDGDSSISATFVLSRRREDFGFGFANAKIADFTRVRLPCNTVHILYTYILIIKRNSNPGCLLSALVITPFTGNVIR